MNITWIVENWVKEPSYTELAEAIKNQGFNLIEINGDYSKKQLEPVMIGSHNVVFQGSIGLAKMVRETLYNCRPVVWLTEANYKTTKYYAYFGGLLFNDNPVWTNIAQLGRKKLFYYQLLGKECMLFVRPDSGEKPFPAGLIDLQDFDKIYQGCIEPSGELDELVLLSSPKNINAEFRFVVSKYGEIIAQSTYRWQGLITKIPSVPPEATKKCLEVLERGFHPDPVYVIDICADNDWNYWLLEINSFSSAGLYACDKNKIVKRVSEIVFK